MDLPDSKLPRSTDPSDTETPDSNSSSKPSQIRTCSECKTTKTPVWRVGPNGPKSLCNACGIKYRKRKREVKVKDINRKVIELKKNCMLREEEQAAFVLMDLSSGLIFT